MPRRMCLFACLGLLQLTTPASTADWPQFLGPQRDGISPETGLIKTWPKKGPPVLWEKAVGEGFSGPVIAGDRVIAFHRVKDEEVVECLGVSDGKRLWRFAYPTEFADDFGKGNGPRSTPVITGKRVVTLGADGTLHCIDLASGEKIWARLLLKEYRPPPSFFGVGTSPVVEDNLVLVNVGAREAGIVAFSLEDGKELWKATSDAASYSSPIVRTIDGTKHAIFFTRDGVVVLDPKNGDVRHKQRWRARIDASVNAATPLVFGDQAFFSSSYDTGALLLRLRKDGADKLWSGEDVMSNHYNTCIHHEGHLYGFDGRQEAGPSFRCVDVKTRKIVWDRERFGCGSMILAEGRLILITETGDLVLVEATPKEYRELARARVLENAPIRAQIALSGGRLFARDQAKLLCLRLTER